MSLNLEYKKIISILKNDGVGVMPTDTLYGLVGKASSKKAVKRIYEIKGRNKKKPLIILISSIKDLKKFGVSDEHPILKKVWPGPVSVTLEHTSKVFSKKFFYLNRGGKSLAFRLPKKKSLIEILKKTGPLVAPSANPEGLLPAANIKQAREYFGPARPRQLTHNEGGLAHDSSGAGGDKVDFYVSGGTLKGNPSTLVSIDKVGKVKVLRGIPRSRILKKISLRGILKK